MPYFIVQKYILITTIPYVYHSIGKKKTKKKIEMMSAEPGNKAPYSSDIGFGFGFGWLVGGVCIIWYCGSIIP